jgi:purine-binding chemotaxis protein CheW
VSSEDQNKRDAFAAIQQLMSQSPSMAALQMQLAQGQYGIGSANAASGDLPPVVLGEQHLVFSLAERELAVKAELVQGVERLVELTPVPNVAPWISGVMNLRGSIVSVVDLRTFLGLEQLPYTPRTRLLSLQSNDMVICLVVDGVSEMLPIPASAINSDIYHVAVPSWVAPYATGSVIHAQRAIAIIDVVRLLFSEKMQRYKA